MNPFTLFRHRPRTWEDARTPPGTRGALVLVDPVTNRARIVGSPGLEPQELAHLLGEAALAALSVPPDAGTETSTESDDQTAD